MSTIEPMEEFQLSFCIDSAHGSQGSTEKNDSSTDFQFKQASSHSIAYSEKRCAYGRNQRDIMDYVDDEESSGPSDLHSQASPESTMTKSEGSTRASGRNSNSSDEMQEEEQSDCCLPAIRFFLFWIFVAATVFLGMEISRFARDRNDLEIEEEVSNSILLWTPWQSYFVSCSYVG